MRIKYKYVYKKEIVFLDHLIIHLDNRYIEENS